MSAREFTQWRALIEIVEPHEREEQQEAAKNKRG